MHQGKEAESNSVNIQYVRGSGYLSIQFDTVVSTNKVTVEL